MSRLVVSFCGATEMQGKASQSEVQFELHKIRSRGQAVPGGFGSLCHDAVQTVCNE